MDFCERAVCKASVCDRQQVRDDCADFLETDEPVASL